ncbi:hypothetical protein N0V88_003749 [Collariella sp. IMI 366227]|nr:hypothetical protein N0V88_003749 [Collariella sp. IMI 366227]
MLCGINYSTPHSTHRRFLRSFRSHRSLRLNHWTSGTNTDSTVGNTSEEMPRRHRPNDVSSLARPSLDSSTSSRPSTSSRAETIMSVEWDPLRLHPALAPASSPPLRDTFDESISRPYQPQELRQARSSHNLRRPSEPSYQSLSAAANTIIYDGFDFGFDNKPTPASTPTPTISTTISTTSTTKRPRAPSPTPSDASSECSLTFSSSSSSVSAEDDSPPRSHGSGPGARAVKPRYTTGLGPEGDDFLKRGGWKRRGIVFIAPEGEEEAGEEECWEI